MYDTTFWRELSSESACRKNFKELREFIGITCRKCNSKNHFWLSSKEQWQCRNCNFRTTLKAGTFMHASNLKISEWYKAMHYMTLNKKNLSAKQMQRLLGKSNYETAWRLMQKIRNVMKSMEFDRMTGMLEILERKMNPDVQHHELLDLSTNYIDREFKNRYPYKSKIRLHLKTAQQHFLNNNNQWITIRRSSQSSINTGLKICFDQHAACTMQDTKKWNKLLPYNFKMTVLGTHHKIRHKYLQNYIAEFLFKINRRWQPQEMLWHLLYGTANNYLYNSGYSHRAIVNAPYLNSNHQLSA